MMSETDELIQFKKVLNDLLYFLEASNADRDAIISLLYRTIELYGNEEFHEIERAMPTIREHAEKKEVKCSN